MREERIEFSKWWLWIVGLVIVTGVAFAGLKYFSTVSERIIFEQSYQKQSGDTAKLNAYKAELSRINTRLLDEPYNVELKSQKAMLETQIQSIK